MVVALLMAGCAHAQTDPSGDEESTDDGSGVGDETTEDGSGNLATDEPAEDGEPTDPPPPPPPPPTTTTKPPTEAATTTKSAVVASTAKGAAKKPVTQQKPGVAKRKKKKVPAGKVKKLVLQPSKQQIVIKLSPRKIQPQPPASKNKKKNTVAKLVPKNNKLFPTTKTSTTNQN
jgi:hypothetical protein